jgi:hypothetical protein
MPAGAQVKPSVFLSPGSGAELHTRIAILPFYCIEDPADFTGNPAYQAVQDKQIGLELQHAMYTLMVGFGPNFTVKVQDFYTTNDLLRKEGLTDFRFKNMQEITRLLQVDAVLWAVVTHNPTLFREDDSIKVVMQRQCIPGDAKKRTFFFPFLTWKAIVSGPLPPTASCCETCCILRITVFSFFYGCRNCLTGRVIK